jgi:serine protease AprX
LFACLWQAFPEFRNMDIIDAVQRSAHKFNNPDERFGYGIPNFKTAHSILLKKRNTSLYQNILAEQFIKAYPVPFNEEFSVLFKAKNDGAIQFRLLQADGRVIESKSVNTSMDEFYKIPFKPNGSLPAGVYLLHYDDGTNNGTLKIIRN